MPVRRAAAKADILGLVLEARDGGDQAPACLGDLVKCLPGDLWRISGRAKKVVGLVEPARQTTEEDWVRFDRYAERVTGITYSTTASPGVTCALYRWLLSARPDRELFPNLQAIEWKCKVGEDERDVQLSLDSCRLLVRAREGPCPPNAIPSVLAYLCHAAPHKEITSFSVDLHCATAADMDAFQSGLAEALASLRGLRSLDLIANQGVAFDNLQALATLPCLQELRIENESEDSHFINNAPWAADDEPPPPKRVFRALRKLELKLHNLHDAAVVLSSFAFPSLEALEVEGAAYSRSRHFYRILRLAAMRCSKERLQEIWVGSGEEGGYTNRDAGAVTTASLGYLCTFPNLQRITVYSEMCIVADDDFLNRLASTCHHLESLTLFSLCSPRNREWQKPRVTLCGLAYLVKHCPQLRSIGLGIDTSDAHTLMPPSEGCCNPRVIRFDVGKLPLLGDPARVGAFLFALFPNLEEIIDEFGCPEDATAEGWDPVMEVIQNLRVRCRLRAIGNSALWGHVSPSFPHVGRI